MLTRRRRFPPDLPDPSAHDPTDAELARYAAEGRILVSLLFWSGMLREIENLYAVFDLAALTGVKAGLVLTAASLAYWPSPLDLLAVPAERGGVYPQLEVLLGSCGDGAAIESAMPKDRLRDHLAAASRRLDELGLPAAWRPRGWWPTLDAELVSRPRWQAAAPVAWNHSARYRLEILYRADRGNGNGHSGDGLRSRLSNEARRALRQTALKPLFRGRRPFDGFRPGPLDEGVARMVRSAGFSYMFTKAGFGDPPHVAYRDGDFVALNHTAGQWDGWTPFETVSGVGDLRRAEARLLGRRRPGWLVGTIDTCLWALSGELWRAAPGLAAIARFAAEGGTSGRLVNVRPAVLARYARLIGAAGQATGSQVARVAFR
jgi:hypothetical protein